MPALPYLPRHLHVRQALYKAHQACQVQTSPVRKTLCQAEPVYPVPALLTPVAWSGFLHRCHPSSDRQALYLAYQSGTEQAPSDREALCLTEAVSSRISPADTGIQSLPDA